MNKYSLPTILFAGLLLAGCSNPKPVVTVEDVHMEEVKQEPPPPPPPPPSTVDSSAKKQPHKK